MTEKQDCGHCIVSPDADKPILPGADHWIPERESSGKSLDSTKKQSTGDAVSTTRNDEDKQYPTGLRLTLIFVCLCLTTLLVALDGTIIAVAIPTITTQFNSLQDTAWYNATFLLTTSAFQIPFGRAYTLLSTKWTFLSSIVIFEIGSAVCGAAPSSIALIIGRAIAGIGGAGIFGGGFIIVAQATPLRKRSLFIGFIGATFGISAVVGPLIGGVLTTRVSWRWCFYINLPIGAIVIPVVAFFLPRSIDTPTEGFKGKSWWQIIARFDPAGTLVFLISIICLVLALQWGGTRYPWSDTRVIIAMVVFSVLFVVWIVLQWYEGDNATIPKDIITQRSVVGATWYTTCGAAAFTIVVYYLPLWFQAIRQNNAEESGIRQLPLILGVVTSSLTAGGGVYLIGYYVPFLILGTILSSVGSAVLMLLKPDAGAGEWIGYQILFGAGVGMSLEQCNVAIQTVLPEEKIPAGTSLSIFARSIGGSLGIAIAQNVFEQKLRKNLDGVLPDVDFASLISASGATDLIPKVQQATGGNDDQVRRVLELYNNALSQTFLVALILSAMTLIGALAVEWKSVKKEKKAKQDSVSAQKETTADREAVC